MRFKKLNLKEDGYLLLESLLTLVILMAIITVLSPLVVNWLAKHQEAKSLVEANRQLYESSIILNANHSQQLIHEKSTIQIDKHRIQIKETGTEVVIYESSFKK